LAVTFALIAMTQPRMKNAVAPCIALGLFASACGGDDSQPAATNTSNSASTPVSSNKARTGASIKVMSSRYGKLIFDGGGRALYLFTRERTSRSRCYGDCATAWPPFLTNGRPRAGKGARSKLLGTTRRRDGKTQVTYRGHPLYYYQGDRKPGQILCQDVDEFGGTWLVVSPTGRAVH
jgi:predicted lipoprotein with Yx(FWY)xxD motif